MFHCFVSVKLYELKTYHEVIDEIYYEVTHLEPWEKGSRKTAGQTGMCGGVSVSFYIFASLEVALYKSLTSTRPKNYYPDYEYT